VSCPQAQQLLQKYYCIEGLHLPGSLESVFSMPLNLSYFGEAFMCQLLVSKYAICLLKVFLDLQQSCFVKELMFSPLKYRYFLSFLAKNVDYSH
jgi:hypothetical protein